MSDIFNKSKKLVPLIFTSMLVFPILFIQKLCAIEPKGIAQSFLLAEDFIRNRVLRSKEIEDFVPKILESSPHMYLYRKEEGVVFSKVSNLPLFDKLLKTSKLFWKKIYPMRN